MAATDPLDEVNSSIGLTGGVDGVMILKRERTRADATLFVAGRDVEEEKEFALRWDQNTAGWALVGSAKEFGTSHRVGVAQLRLFELEALGEIGWLKALRLDEYSPQSPRRSQVLQQTLFACSEAP